MVKPGDWTGLETLDPIDLYWRVVANLDELPVFDVDADREDETIASLPEPLRIVYVLNWMDFEVTQAPCLRTSSTRMGAMRGWPLRRSGSSAPSQRRRSWSVQSTSWSGTSRRGMTDTTK